jgi:DNA-binding response OmpR family regulator
MYPTIQTGRPPPMSSSKKSARQSPGIALDTGMLIIDNDRPSSISLSFMLSLRGYDEIRSVRSAARAVIIAGNFRPGVVFLDVDLPNTDTMELARQLRKGSSAHGPRLIALTSSAEHPLRESAREAGFERYLVKPCAQEEVDKILRLPSSGSA